METRHPDLFRNTKFEETQAWEGLLCGPALKKRWHRWLFGGLWSLHLFYMKNKKTI